MCQSGNLGDEQHLVLLVVFECPALQRIKDKSSGLFGVHAATMVQSMWQHETRAVHERVYGRLAVMCQD